jgi:hypothetical protein
MSFGFGVGMRCKTTYSSMNLFDSPFDVVLIERDGVSCEAIASDVLRLEVLSGASPKR